MDGPISEPQGLKHAKSQHPSARLKSCPPELVHETARSLPALEIQRRVGTAERRRVACSPTSTHALLLVPRGRPALRLEPALRPDLPHSARASQMRKSLGSQTR